MQKVSLFFPERWEGERQGCDLPLQQPWPSSRRGQGAARSPASRHLRSRGWPQPENRQSNGYCSTWRCSKIRKGDKKISVCSCCLDSGHILDTVQPQRNVTLWSCYRRIQSPRIVARTVITTIANLPSMCGKRTALW